MRKLFIPFLLAVTLFGADTTLVWSRIKTKHAYIVWGADSVSWNATANDTMDFTPILDIGNTTYASVSVLHDCDSLKIEYLQLPDTSYYDRMNDCWEVLTDNTGSDTGIYRVAYTPPFVPYVAIRIISLSTKARVVSIHFATRM